MKMEILSEKENPLRKRKRFWVSVEHAGKETPSRHELLSQVAKELGSKPELTIIDKIFSERGRPRSSVKALIYKDKKDIPADILASQERKIKSYLENKKNKQAEAAPPAEEPAGEEKPGEGAPEGGVEEVGEKPAEEASEAADEGTEERPEEQKPEEAPDKEEEAEASSEPKGDEVAGEAEQEEGAAEESQDEKKDEGDDKKE